MTRDLSVHLLPTLFEPAELRGGVAVVIDLLRASTTIVHALAAGARGVVPCGEIEEARRLAAGFPEGEVVLGGERAGTRIPGFQLDNSPLAYTPEAVGGKTVVFTTTNGTRALLRCAEADRILVGALVNLAAVAETLVEDGRPIHLVCAGTRGKISGDDVLCAGAIATAVHEALGRPHWNDDEARIALDVFAAHSTDSALLQAVGETLGGRDLRELGFDEDIRRSATRNLFALVPEYDSATGTIRSSA